MRFGSTKRRFSDINDQKCMMHCSESASEANPGEKTEIVRDQSDLPPVKDNNFDNNDSSVATIEKRTVEDNNKSMNENDNPQSTDSEVSFKNQEDEATYDNQVVDASHSKFSEVLGKLGQDAKMVILQYSQAFNASEVYEQQSTQAVTELAAHATVLEQRLKLQKELLCNRLQTITQNLKIES